MNKFIINNDFYSLSFERNHVSWILTIKIFIGKTLLLNKLVSCWILLQRVQNLMFFLCCDDRPSDQGMGLRNQNHEEG